jgi:hypothetical protein
VAGTRPSRVVETLLVAALVGALLAYAAFALLVARWWISGLAAPVVALLLALRHRRARFSTYVFLSVVAGRGVVMAYWPATAFALAALATLQTAPALRLWPRLRAPARMARP